jgi:hypothetical protein
VAAVRSWLQTSPDASSKLYIQSQNLFDTFLFYFAAYSIIGITFSNIRFQVYAQPHMSYFSRSAGGAE